MHNYQTFVLGRRLEGLEIATNPEMRIEDGSRILAAWYLGYPATCGESGIIPGRLWFAVVWRDAGGELRSFGRWAQFEEYQGAEKKTICYTSISHSEQAIIDSFERVSRRLSREWCGRLHKAEGLANKELLDWARSTGGLLVRERHRGLGGRCP
jgi:hypothetical protein